jgi:hypothetical protein
MKATRLVFKSFGDGEPRIILCKILSHDDTFYNVLTGAGRTYSINKKAVLSIEPTDQEFRLQEVQG